MYLEGVVLIRMTKCFRVKHDGLKMRAWRLGFGVCDLRFRFWGFAGSKDMKFSLYPIRDELSSLGVNLKPSLRGTQLRCFFGRPGCPCLLENAAQQVSMNVREITSSELKSRDNLAVRSIK